MYTGGEDSIETETVSISSGKIRGSINLDTQIASFKGVPYAAPPVGALRWAPPEPAVPWAGVKTAIAHGPACVQQVGGEGPFLDLMMDGVGMPGWKKWLVSNLSGYFIGGELSEDCLTLTVWAPANLEESKSQPIAVMVWYHGGAHKFGSGDASQYDASKLAQRDVIVVTINYRLGVLGFMAHPELSLESPYGSSGNYGTLDQIHALTWVKENIHAFGGDPDNITIFGESAGGHSVGQVMASPLSHHLPDRAIAQSGIGTHQIATLQDAELAGLELARALGVTGENQLTRLRGLAVEDINNMFGKHPELDILSHPVIDGWVFPKSTAEIFAAGEQAPIPLLIGSNADEGTLLAPLIGSPFVNHLPGPETAEEYRNLIWKEYPEQAGKLLELYPAESDDDLFMAINDLFGDHFFGMQAWFAALKHSKSGNQTYLYFLTRTSPSPTQWAGAFHGADIQFVFGNFFPLFPKNDFDDELSDQVMNYWAQFAKTGNPNSQDWPKWDAMDINNPQEMELGRIVGQRPVERQNTYELLATSMERYLERDLSTE
jgi:para-nitrobenzyl esterase